MKTPEEQRHIELSWQLLEHKCLYYMTGSTKIDDYSYDLLEKEYRQLCSDLWLEDSISDMVGFDWKRPSCKLVMEKLGIFAPIGKNKKSKDSEGDSNDDEILPGL